MVELRMKNEELSASPIKNYRNNVRRPKGKPMKKRTLLVFSYPVISSASKKIKKTFFLFLPSHPHNPAGSPVFIGVSVVRVSVRVNRI